MHRLKKALKTVVGALGWGLLGGLILQLGVGPSWLGWCAVVSASVVIAIAIDKAFSPNSYGSYK